jgi:hypothetical protein
VRAALAGLTLVSFLMDSLSVRCVLCCASFLGDALFLQYVGFHLPADGDTSPNIGNIVGWQKIPVFFKVLYKTPPLKKKKINFIFQANAYLNKISTLVIPKGTLNGVA